MKTYLLFLLAAAIVIGCTGEDAVGQAETGPGLAGAETEAAEAEQWVELGRVPLTTNKGNLSCNEELSRAMSSIRQNADMCQHTVMSAASKNVSLPDQTGCIFKCVFKLENIMGGESGVILTEETFAEGIKGKATGDRPEHLTKLFKRCNDRFGSQIISDDDVNCPGYERLGKCIQRGVERICDEPEALTPRPDIESTAGDVKTEDAPEVAQFSDDETTKSQTDDKTVKSDKKPVAKEEL